jgi:hypothetical protein
MAKSKDWIKTRDDDFFNQQGAYVNRVVTNAPSWGIPAGAVNVLTVLRAEYEPLYTKVQDKKNRTGGDVAAHRDCRKRYQTALRKFHKEWVLNNSLIPVADKVILVGKARDIEPTPRGKIMTFPIIGLKGMGGGDIEVRCRVTTDQTRFSMHPTADAIECKFVFVPAGEMPPEDPETCPKTQVSKKARFIISCGVKNAGQSLYGFFRWANQTNPQNSGPWTTKAQGVVVA